MATSPEADSPHVGAKLRLLWQWVRDEVSEEVARAGYANLDPAHIRMLWYPGLDGTRPSDLAAQRQISKQTVSYLIGDLEQRGYLIRVRDPHDGRARIVRLTAAGRKLEKVVNKQALATERRIAAKLGPQRFAALNEALEELTRDLM